VGHRVVAHQSYTFQAAVAVQSFEVVLSQLQEPRQHAGHDHSTRDDKERLVLARIPTNYASAAFENLDASP